MRKIIYKSYEDDAVELLKDSNGEIIVKDKKNGKFLFIKNEELLPNNITWVERKPKVSSMMLYCYLFVFFVIFLFNVFLLLKSSELIVTPKNNIICILIPPIYICISCIFHEFGHILAMKLFGRKAGKIHFKFNYIFPALYVNVNEIYLLTKNEKIIVHSAGIFVNLFFNTVLFCFFLFNTNSVLNYFYIGILSISWSTIYNLIPFLNSDGYKLLLCLINRREYKENCKNGLIVRIIKWVNIVFSLFYLMLVINDILHKTFNIDFIQLFQEALCKNTY